MTDWNFDNDRRQHFRIEEQTSIEYLPVADTETPITNLFPRSEKIRLLEDLQLMDEEAETHLRRISEEDKILAAYLRTLNRKIERLTQSMLQPDEEQRLTDITLSETGLSFIVPATASNTIAPSQLLAIRLQLLPEGYSIECYARVLYHYPQQTSVRIGCEFVNIEERYRHQIGKHCMESQARQRRTQRQKS